MKKIFSTKNGSTYGCGNCPCVHLEFKNFVLNLSRKNFDSFMKFIFSIRPSECIAAHKNFPHKRKILLEMQGMPIRLAFTRREFAELKLLFEGTAGMLRLREYANSVSYSLN